MYARDASQIGLSAATPAYVYAIDIDDPPPAGMRVVDPIHEVSAHNANPLAAISYHHDGDMNFLLGVLDPVGMATHLRAPIRQPPGSGGTVRPANLTLPLETLARSLRDAEILVVGAIPAICVRDRYDIY